MRSSGGSERRALDPVFLFLSLLLLSSYSLKIERTLDCTLNCFFHCLAFSSKVFTNPWFL